jgi:quercetin dioxygenase-like cupin family protein
MTFTTSRTIGVAALSLFAAIATAHLSAADTEKPAMTSPATGTLTFTRLYTSADGNSHFVDETLELKPLGGSGLENSLAASRIGDVKGAMFLALKAGAVEPYHIAPRRQFMICLRGVVEVTAGDGEKRRAVPGQFILLEDTSGKGHITHSIGSEDHVALAFPLPDDVLTRTRK